LIKQISIISNLLWQISLWWHQWRNKPDILFTAWKIEVMQDAIDILVYAKNKE